jgi:hypothetical protein
VNYPTAISNSSDAWQANAAATEAAIRAIKGAADSGSLRDYQPTNPRPTDPPATVIPGHTDLPAESPDRIPELNRTTVLVSKEGKHFPNLWNVSSTPVQYTPPTLRPVPTVEQVAEEIESLKQAVASAEDQFKSDQANRPAIHARMIRIGAELAPLVERVRVLEAELNDLKSIPHPEKSFTDNVTATELAVQQAAGHALECLQENWAQHIFGISFRRNPGTLKGASDSAREDINLGLSDLRKYISSHQVSFGTCAQKTVDGARNTLKRLATNLNEVLAFLKAKRK